jgi:glycosyltransferase involved in cell wall biosynthesis
MQQRKIIFVNRYFHPDISATSQLLADLAFFLAGEGLRVYVVTSRQRYDDPNAGLLKYEVVGNVLVSRVWSSRFGRNRLTGRALDYLTFYSSAMWHLIMLVRQGDIIVAKTDPPLISVIAMAVTRMRRAHLVNWLHDYFPEIATVLNVRGLDGSVGRMLQWLRNRSLITAVVNVAIGEKMADLIKARLPQATDRVRIIHNWADGKAIYPIPAVANPMRKLWGLKDKFVVGYSGNMGRGHEFETLLRAAEALRTDDRFVFVLIGDGAQHKEIEQRIKEWSLGNVMLRPYQPRELLAQSLSVPDVHVVSMHPELEGLMLPSKLYAIAAVGRPTVFIGHPVGEVAILLREGRCGFAVAQGNWSGLVDQLQRLANNENLCAGMGRNARERFERRFDKPLAMKAWKELLRAL